jgi:hypothetical protein
VFLPENWPGIDEVPGFLFAALARLAKGAPGDTLPAQAYDMRTDSQEVPMRCTDDAAYLFRRAKEEARKTAEAAERGANPAEIAAHRELALRYKVRALARSSGAVPSIDATG